MYRRYPGSDIYHVRYYPGSDLLRPGSSDTKPVPAGRLSDGFDRQPGLRFFLDGNSHYRYCIPGNRRRTGDQSALTAGMVISGAYVGDKFSPLSDTTNLAAAVAQTGLFDHVTAMISTTAPTFIISLILYTILGLNIDTSNFDASVATDLQQALAEGFNLNPLVLLPIAVIIVVCILKMPGL